MLCCAVALLWACLFQTEVAAPVWLASAAPAEPLRDATRRLAAGELDACEAAAGRACELAGDASQLLVAEVLRGLSLGLRSAQASLDIEPSRLPVARLDHMRSALELWREGASELALVSAQLAANQSRSAWELHNIELFRTGLTSPSRPDPASIPAPISLPIAVVSDVDSDLQAILGGVREAVAQSGLRLRRGRRAHLDPQARLEVLGDMQAALEERQAVAQTVLGQENFGGIDFSNYIKGSGLQLGGSSRSSRRSFLDDEPVPDLISQAREDTMGRLSGLQRQSTNQNAATGSSLGGVGGGSMPPCDYTGPVQAPAHLTQGMSSMGMADKYQKAAETWEWAASKYASVGCLESAEWCRREAQRYRDIVASLRSR